MEPGEQKYETESRSQPHTINHEDEDDDEEDLFEILFKPEDELYNNVYTITLKISSHKRVKEAFK